MAKRRKKNKDAVPNLIVGIMILIFLWGVYETKSPITAGILAGAWFILCFTLVRIYYYTQNQRSAKSGIHEIDKMDGIQFEHYLKQLYQKHGYQAKVTQASGDFGADLIIEKEEKKSSYKLNDTIKMLE